MTRQFVAFSEIRCPEAGVAGLVDAFANRLGQVEQAPGFDHLEVWQDEGDETRFVMVSWWTTKHDFTAYMQSDRHHRSHERITAGPDRPRPAHFSRYRVVAR